MAIFLQNPKAFPSLHVASLHRIFLCKHHHHINLNQRQCSHDHHDQHDQHDHHEHDNHDHQGHSGGFEQSGICGHSDRGGKVMRMIIKNFHKTHLYEE